MRNPGSVPGVLGRIVSRFTRSYTLSNNEAAGTVEKISMVFVWLSKDKRQVGSPQTKAEQGVVIRSVFDDCYEFAESSVGLFFSFTITSLSMWWGLSQCSY